MVGKLGSGCVRVCRGAWSATVISSLVLAVFSLAAPHFAAARPDTTTQKPHTSKGAETSSPKDTSSTEADSGAMSQQANVPGASALELTPSEIRFTDVPTEQMVSQMVRVTNTGEGLVEIDKIVAPADEFRIFGQKMPFVIAHGTCADFTISYHPKRAAQSTSQILIYTKGLANPRGLPLSASSIAVRRDLTANVAALEFADVAVGSQSTRQISLRNNGNDDITISSVRAEGDEFAVVAADSTKLLAGQTMSFPVSFMPKTAGSRNGALKIASSDGEELNIPLTATAAAGSRSVVRLQWEANEGGVAAYTVYRASDATGPYEQIAAALSSSEYTDSGLAAGHTYYYVVSSISADQTESEYSEPITATIPEG